MSNEKRYLLTLGGLRVGDAFCTGDFIPGHARKIGNSVDIAIGAYAKEAWFWQIENTALKHYVRDVYCYKEPRFPVDSYDYVLFYEGIKGIDRFPSDQFEIIPYTLDYMVIKEPITVLASMPQAQGDKIGIQSRTVSTWKNQENIEKINFPSQQVISFETPESRTGIFANNKFIRLEGKLNTVIEEIFRCSIFVGAASSLTLLNAKLGRPTVTCHFEQNGPAEYGSSWNGKSIDLFMPSVEQIQDAVDELWGKYSAV